MRKSFITSGGTAFTVCLLLWGLNASATLRYVNVNSVSPESPFTSWATAARNIQEAFDVAAAGDEIQVTNGVYQTGGRALYGAMTNRVVVYTPVTLRSVNGPASTIIMGKQAPGGGNGDGAIRCAFLVTGVVLSGFTLTNGATRSAGDPGMEQSGGAVLCNDTQPVLTNCVLTGNSAFNAGGAAYNGTLNNCTLVGNSAGYGGGAALGTLSNCTLATNSAQFGGGGAAGCILNNCTLAGNSAQSEGGGAADGTLNNCTLTDNSAQAGGGAAGDAGNNCTLNNCTLAGNSASSGGGAWSATLNNCTLTDNSAELGGGAAGAAPSYNCTLNKCTLAGNSAQQGGGAYSVALNNCILTGNSASWGGGATFGTLNNCTLSDNSATYCGGGADGGTLNNCTLMGNSADSSGGGEWGCGLNNCIVYYNTAPDGNYDAYSSLNYCCTTPLPTPDSGTGNFTNAPVFVDQPGGNLRLQTNSPCINAGSNAYAPGATDLDGNPRISGGTVDVGAYEFQVLAAIVTLSNLSQVYDGTPKPVSYTTTPPGLTLVLTYNGSTNPPANVGSYTVVGTIRNPIYQGSATNTLTIVARVRSFALDTDPGWQRQGEWAFGKPTGLGGTSHGHPDPAFGATGSNVFGINLNGDYSTTIGGPYYLTAGPLNFAACTGMKLQFRRWLNTDYQPYVYATIEISTNGSVWSQVWANGTTEIADAAWSVVAYDISAYADNQTNVYVRWGHRVGQSGAFAYSGWNIDDIEFLGIGKAMATVTLGNLAQTYDGTAKSVTCTTTPLGLAVNLTYNGSTNAPTNAAIYTVIATINDLNYQGSATNSLVIGQALAAVTLTNLSQVYDGTAQSVTVTTTPPGLAVNVTYSGSPNAPTNVGSYIVIGTISDPNYQGSATNTLNIVDITTLAAIYTTASDVPLTVGGFTAAGKTVDFTLNFAPPTGAELMVVNNTGLGFINGTFDNLAQGQTVALSYGGTAYSFVANYYGGSGNDLVLVWANNRAFAWGWNTAGALGDNTTTDRPLPVPVTATGVLAGRTVLALAAGGQYDHSLALCSDGSVAAWGYNGNGQLGDNTTTDRHAPVAANTASGVSALYGKTVVAIAAGGDHSLALCSDGTVAAWGDNDNGQLGDNTTIQRNVPVAVNTNSGVSALYGKTVVAIAAGLGHSLALCSDGTVAAWGWNSNGQLGDNTTTDRHSPVAVNTVSGVSALYGKTAVAIAAGGDHSLALCSDGTVAAWGWNTDGELGDNHVSGSQSPVPVAVSTVSGVSALYGKTVLSIAAGVGHSLALCSDGTVAAWGYNYYGQIGDNDSPWDCFAPVAVNTSSGVSALYGKTVVAIAAGLTHSLALCSDGTVAAWGDNRFGRLGDNTTTSRSVPVAVNTTPLAASERFTRICSGSWASHTLALVGAPQLPAPSIGVIGNGVTITNSDATPSTVDGSDFGAALVGGGSIVQAFTIQNRGTAPLNLIGTPKVAVSGPQAADFAVTLQPTSPVAGGAGTTTFQVTFTPNASGTRKVSLSITNDDSAKNPYTFAIQGTGTNAMLSATLTLGNLSQTYDGTAKSVTVTTTPPGLAVNVTYSGSPNAPTNVGSYIVIGTISDPSYQGSATNTLVIAAVAACVPPPSGLVAWWPADGNALDIVGGDNGTLSGGASFVSGEVGQTFSFDGTNGIINLNGPSLSGNVSYTLAFWAQPFAYIQDSALVCFGTSGVTDGAICVAMWSSGTKVTVAHYSDDHIFGQSWLLNQWQQVVVTYDSSAGVESLYFNGSFSESWNPSPLALNSSRPMTFGRWAWGGQYYNGLLDEVQFFNRALNGAEIQAIYNAGSAGMCRPLPPHLTTPARLANGSFQFAFTSSSGALFSVLASTNLALPFSNWAVLGGATEISPGQFQFSDPQATNSRERFYRVRSQ